MRPPHGRLPGTLATNMAGRGTDISLGPGVEALGGLFVILTEYHESTRIDRQLLGRCARQGQPGECVAITAIDDDLYTQHGGGSCSALVRWRQLHGTTPAIWMGACRRTVQDRELEQSMGFSGDPL